MSTYICKYCNKNLSKSNKLKHEKTKIHQKNLKIKSGSDCQNSNKRV